MLHIATVHFKSPRWIAVQRRELARHLTMPHRVWASIERIDPSHGRCFDRLDEGSGSHAEKLNRLARQIAAEAADDDLLMFLDGDAFPIADPEPLIERGLSGASLLAVRRTENHGDPQPHPCFCVTEVSTWRRLPGDWSEGFTWPGPHGRQITDVGANLLRRLQLTGTPWKPVLRSNRRNPHAVLFGVYGDVIYHHGAGFRWPFTRVDVAALDRFDPLEGSPEMVHLGNRNHTLSEQLFRRIEADDPDWHSELL